MKVYGQEITSEMVQTALLKLSPQFTYRECAGAFAQIGVHDYDRCADRVLQRLKKLDAVSYSKGVWRFTTSKVFWL